MDTLQTVLLLIAMVATMVDSHDYGDALTKSILFFEGQRSGKLPPTQRITWRKDSALRDGFEIGVSFSSFGSAINPNSKSFFLSLDTCIRSAFAVYLVPKKKKKKAHVWSCTRTLFL